MALARNTNQPSTSAIQARALQLLHPSALLYTKFITKRRFNHARTASLAEDSRKTFRIAVMNLHDIRFSCLMVSSTMRISSHFELLRLLNHTMFSETFIQLIKVGQPFWGASMCCFCGATKSQALRPSKCWPDKAPLCEILPMFVQDSAASSLE